MTSITSHPWGGGDFHMKVTGILVASLRGVSCKFWYHLRFLGRKANLFTRTGIAWGCALKNIYMKKSKAVNL